MTAVFPVHACYIKAPLSLGEGLGWRKQGRFSLSPGPLYIFVL